MKKLFALLAVVLAVASCQKESNDLAVNMGEQETLITVALPEATRANSADSGLDNGVLAEHDLRFILEIYQGENCYRMESIGQETEATFPVRVVQGHEYDFVVWADFVAKGAVELAENDIFYNTNGDKGLQNITILNNAAMTEARDAYYGVAHLDADKAVSTISNITLTRPFAKVRVITTDLSKCIEKLGLQPSTATVTYTTETYDKFDARNKNVWSVNSNDNEKTIDYDDSTPVYGEDNLFVDYILVPQGKQSTVKFDLNVTNVINRSFNTDIAVEANKLTTIKGNILTNGSDIKVDVNDDFASETIYLEGDVTLTENLVIDRPMVVRKGATAVLDLNGFNITNKTKNDAYGEDEAIIVYGNLTIKGQGTVTANSMAVWARGKGNNAVVNIYGGTYYGCAEGFANSGRSVIYASGGNTINIYGGKFQALAEDTTSFNLMENGRGYAAVNVEDKNNNIISVYGGSFYKQNPADPRTENPARSFVAEGCRVEADGDWFKVIYDPYYGYTKVKNVTELNDAIAQATADINIVFLNDIEGDVTLNNTKGKITIHGDGKTYTGIMTLKSDVTFKNVNFDGKGLNNYAITTRGTDYLTIEGCTAKNYGYGFVQLASGTVLTTVKNVTVSNMNYGVKVDYSNAVVIENANITAGVAAVLNSNYGEKTITIKDSKLNILGTWTRNNTLKTNYVFEGDNTINTFIIDAAIDNFKLVGGATLTAPNAITVTTVDGYTVEYADGKYISK